MKKEGLLEEYSECSLQHEPWNVYEMIIWSLVNSVLNNYSKKLNDNLNAVKVVKKGKAEKFSKVSSS